MVAPPPHHPLRVCSHPAVPLDSPACLRAQAPGTEHVRRFQLGCHPELWLLRGIKLAFRSLDMPESRAIGSTQWRVSSQRMARLKEAWLVCTFLQSEWVAQVLPCLQD